MIKFKNKKSKNLNFFLFPGVKHNICFNKTNILKMYFNSLTTLPLNKLFSKLLKERKKFWYLYNLTFKQFKNLKKRIKNKKNLLNSIIKLNMSLDFILFKSKLFPTLNAARYFISNKNVVVNYKVIKFSKFIIKKNDILYLKNFSCQNFIKQNSLIMEPTFLIININKNIIYILRNIFYREIYHFINYYELL